MRFLGKFLILLLTFIIGFLSAFAALFGVGYYAYKTVSLDKIGVDTQNAFDREAAEVQVGALTIEGFISEFNTLKDLNDAVTLDMLVLRYGLKIPTEIDSALPESARNIAVSKLFTQEGITTVLDDLYIGKLMGFDKGPAVPGADGEYYWYEKDTTTEVSGIQSLLVNYTVGDFLNNKFNAEEFTSELTIAKALDLRAVTYNNVYVDDNGTLTQIFDLEGGITVLYNSDGARIGSTIAALSDVTVSELSKGVDKLALSEILGYVSYKDEYYSYNITTSGEDEIVVLTKQSGLTSELAHLTVADFSSGKLDDEIQTIKISSVLGYTYNETEDKYYDSKGDPVTGVIATIAGSTVGNIASDIEDVMVGEASGLIKVAQNGDENDLKWYSEYYGEGSPDNKEATGILASIADLKISELKENDKLVSRIESITVAEALGYVPNKNGDGYVYGSADPAKEGKPVTGVMGVIAGTELGDIQTKVDESSIGEVCGFTRVEKNGEIIWYSVYSETDPTQNKEAGGIMNAIADLTVSQLKDNNALVGCIESITVADALGYTETADGYVDKGNKKVEGVMGVIAGSQLKDIQSKVDGSMTGELMGLTLGSDGVWRDGTAPVHVLINKIAGTPFNEISGITNTLTLADIIPEEDRATGFISLVHPDTKLNDIAGTVNKIFNEYTLSVFVEKNVILVDEDKKHIFIDNPNVDGDIGELTLQQLFTKIANNQITIH
jgi:hypothetical protein